MSRREKIKNWQKPTSKTTGSPSSKYEHRRASTLLRNIQNIWICVGKKTIVSDLRKWNYFNKKQLTLLKMCVKSLLCGPRADLWPFYGFLCKRLSLYIKVNLSECYATMPMFADAHISSLGYLCKNMDRTMHELQHIGSIKDTILLKIKLQQENCEVFKGYSISTITNWIHIWICIDMATISFPVIYFIFETVASLGRCRCLKWCFAPTSKCTCISKRVHGLFVFCLLTILAGDGINWSGQPGS